MVISYYFSKILKILQSLLSMNCTINVLKVNFISKKNYYIDNSPKKSWVFLKWNFFHSKISQYLHATMFTFQIYFKLIFFLFCFLYWIFRNVSLIWVGVFDCLGLSIIFAPEIVWPQVIVQSNFRSGDIIEESTKYILGLLGHLWVLFIHYKLYGFTIAKTTFYI